MKLILSQGRSRNSSRTSLLHIILDSMAAWDSIYCLFIQAFPFTSSNNWPKPVNIRAFIRQSAVQHMMLVRDGSLKQSCVNQLCHVIKIRGKRREYKSRRFNLLRNFSIIFSVTGTGRWDERRESHTLQRMPKTSQKHGKRSPKRSPT